MENNQNNQNQPSELSDKNLSSNENNVATEPESPLKTVSEREGNNVNNVNKKTSLFRKITINATAPGKHPKNTIRCIIKGKKNTRLDEILLEEILTTELSITSRQILNVYNLGKPTEWFVTLTTEELYKSLHMREIAKNTRICNSILLLHLDKYGQRGHFKWVPPTFTHNIVLDILKSLSQPDEPCVTTKIGKGDKWAVDFLPIATVESLPHFIEVDIGGESHTILLQLNGRRTICPLCGTDKHGPEACRSQIVRVRDNIGINEYGEYYEQEEQEESNDENSSQEDETTDLKGSDEKNEWKTVSRHKKNRSQNLRNQHSNSNYHHLKTLPANQATNIESPDRQGQGQSAHGYKPFTMQDRTSSKRTIDEADSPNSHNHSPDNHKQTKTGEVPKAPNKQWRQLHYSHST